jgi:hypothetical protein
MSLMMSSCCTLRLKRRRADFRWTRLPGSSLRPRSNSPPLTRLDGVWTASRASSQASRLARGLPIWIPRDLGGRTVPAPNRYPHRRPSPPVSLRMMRILVVGAGGREHAIVRRLAHDQARHDLHAAPGNPGIAALATVHAVAMQHPEGVVALAKRLDADLVVIGPEQPLADGLADQLKAAGRAVMGPTAACACLETSKAFAKEFMAAHGIPTARFHVCRSTAEAVAAIDEFGIPVVVKADGLAAGKGVVVAMHAPRGASTPSRHAMELQAPSAAAGDGGRRSRSASSASRPRSSRSATASAPLYLRLRAGPQARRRRRRPGAEHGRHGRLFAEPR